MVAAALILFSKAEKIKSGVRKTTFFSIKEEGRRVENTCLIVRSYQNIGNGNLFLATSSVLLWSGNPI